MNQEWRFVDYFNLSSVTAVACLLVCVDGLVPQIQMHLLDGHVLVGGAIVKVALLGSILIGLYQHPRITFAGLPISAWKLCIGFLVCELGYLQLTHDIPLFEILQSFNAYYVMLLVGPAALAFRHAVPERAIIQCIVWLLAISTLIGCAQHLTGEPLLYLESDDESFMVTSWDLGSELRAFGLFSCPMVFGIFCTLCGPLGIALSREHPLQGIALTILAALACYVTLNRQSYVTFPCACSYAAVITFGKKPSRGLWEPLLFLVIAISVMLYGLFSFAGRSDNILLTNSSLIDRIVEWYYYGNLWLDSSLEDQLLGLGIVQNHKIQTHSVVPIDNLVLVLVMHIGVIGLILFGILLIKMWLYLRSEALTYRQPLIIAAVSFWATLLCTGVFCGVTAPFGAIFVLVILCSRKVAGVTSH